MSKGRRKAVAAGLLALIGASGWLAWTHSPFGAAEAEIEKEVALLEKEGVATTPDELRARISKPGVNGAATYLSAMDDVRGTSRVSFQDLAAIQQKSANRAPSPTQRKAAEADIRALAPLFGKLEVASRCDRLDYDRPWEQGIFILFPDLAPYMRMAEVTAFAGYLRVGDGDVAGGRRLLSTSARMARHLGGDPIMASAIVRARIERGVLRATLRSLELRPTDRAMRAAAKEVLSSLGSPIDLRQVIPGEVVIAHRLTLASDRRDIDQWLLDMGLTVDRVPAMWKLMRFRSVRQANEAAFLRYWRTYLEALPHDPEDVAAAEAAEGKADAVMARESPSSRILYDAFRGFEIRNESPLRFALALRRVLSMTLDIVEGTASKILRDPYSNKPLKVQSGASTLAVYSVGPDCRDDGGDFSPAPGPGAAPKDIGLRIRIPDYKSKR